MVICRGVHLTVCCLVALIFVMLAGSRTILFLQPGSGTQMHSYHRHLPSLRGQVVVLGSARTPRKINATTVFSGGTTSMTFAVLSIGWRLLVRWRRHLTLKSLRRVKIVVSAFFAAYSSMQREAWALRRYATRHEEQQAAFITLIFFAFMFVWAFVNGLREDRSERDRIRQEVQRLASLKREFEEASGDEAIGDLDDESFAASLKIAQDSFAKDANVHGDETDDWKQDTAADDDV